MVACLQEQLKQQQLKRGQQVAGQQVVAGLATVQKSITAPLVTNVAQVQAAQAARLQVSAQCLANVTSCYCNEPLSCGPYIPTKYPIHFKQIVMDPESNATDLLSVKLCIASDVYVCAGYITRMS